MPTPTPTRPRVAVADRPNRLRRAVTFSIPPLALLLLGWLGRYAIGAPAVLAGGAAASSSWSASSVSSVSSMSSASSASSASAAASLASTSVEAATVELDAAPSVVDGANARAVETLPDGAVMVDLNLATETDLRALPGVGPSRAKAIVALRQRLGRLRAVDDLARIKGFGRALVRRLRPLVKV